MGDSFTLTAPEEREEGAWVPIPNNTVLAAKVVSVAKKLMPFTDKVTGEEVWKVEFKFQVTEEGQFNGRRIDGLTSTNFVEAEGCKLYQWVKALLGQEIPQGFTLDTDHLQGLECSILVKADKKPRKDGTGDFWQQSVIDVRPAENRPVVAGSAFSGSYDEEPF